MRRLFYLATDLDDAAEIACSLESNGITDKQFIVLSRDENGLRRRFIHGNATLEDTQIVAAARRSNIFGVIALTIFLIIALFAIPPSKFLSMTMLVLCITVFGFVKILVLMGGGMYDDYFKGVFNTKLDTGNAVFVVDVTAKQNRLVKKLFAEYNTTELMVDSSNFASPLPLKKYIRRTLPNVSRSSSNR